MKQLFTVLITLSLITGSLYAVDDFGSQSSGGEFQKVGGAAGQYLKIGVGGRGTGMAGAYGALTNDLTAIHWNPAGLADIKDIAVNFSHTFWFAGFNHSFAALAMPIGENFTAAASFVSFGKDEIPITTLDFPEGTGNTYSYNDMAIGLTFSGYLTDQFSFGFNFKYLSSSLASLGSNGLAFDVGTMYQTGIQGIRLGFALSNLSTSQTYTGVDLQTSKELVEQLYSSEIDAQFVASEFNVPLIFRAGVAGDIWSQEEHKLIGEADFIIASDTPDQYAFGVEYTWNDFLCARTGYKFGSDQFGFAAGLGIKFIGGGFKGLVDYSISPTSDLGLVNRLSLDFTIE